MSHDMRCGCGKFVRYNADYSINFGTYGDLEPPEPDYYCDECIKIEIKSVVAAKRLPTHWIPAKWEAEAARLIGLVRAGPKGCAWSVWVHPDRIPRDYRIIES